MRMLIALRLAALAALAAPVAAVAAGPASKPPLTPDRITRIPALESPAATAVLPCRMGTTGTAVYLVDDLQPPNDAYFVRARPTKCADCAGKPGVWVSSVSITMEFRVPCSQPVEVAIVGPVVDTVCAQPAQWRLFGASTQQVLTASTPGVQSFNVPLGGPLPLIKDAYLRVTFTQDGAECSAPGTRPRLVTTSACSLCVGWNFHAAAKTDLCAAFFPGDPLIWAPVDACLLPAQLLDVGDGLGGPAARLRMVPNPARTGSDIHYVLATGGPTVITLHDVAGRQVRRLLDEVRPPGALTVNWDGRDDAGDVVRPGTYFVTLRANGTRVSSRVVFAK